MHRDELAIGYNAFSIIQTGKDEWGESYPLVFKSFGDYKLPGLVYLTIPGVQLFGLDQFGARFMTTVLASLAIPIMFIFTRTLYRSNKLTLISTALLVFSFWHVSGSRNIYEPIVALTFSLLSYLTLYQAPAHRQKLIFSIIFFFVSIWFYHTPLFIYPILYLLWSLRHWRKFSSQTKKWWGFGLLTVIMLIIVNSAMVATLNQSRSETTIFMSSELNDKRDETLYRFWSSGVPLHPIVTSFERVFQLSQQFVFGLIKGISPEFIFFSGGNNHWHNLRSIGLGNMNPVLLPFGLLGLFYLWKNRPSPANYFLLSLTILSVIPNALTVDSPNINRLMDFHLVLIIIASLGVQYFAQGNMTKNQVWLRWRKYVGIFFVCAYTLVTVRFLASYFLIFNYSLHSSWHEGYAELVTKIEEHRSNYDKVIVANTADEAHIFYLFYNAYPPEKIHQYNQDVDHTHQIENVYFWFDMDNLDLENERVLLVTTANDRHESAVFVINSWEGKPLWQGTELKPIENSSLMSS